MADNEQFTRLWTKAEPVVAGYVGSMVRDFHTCEDILQEIAVILLRKFDQYDHDRPFESWAIGMARNEILARRRSQARSFLSYRQDLLSAITETYDELAPELSRQTLALRRCMGRIQGPNRQILELRYDEALKPRQIAEKIGMAAGAVRVRLSRIRASLRECVEQTLAEGPTTSTA